MLHRPVVSLQLLTGPRAGTVRPCSEARLRLGRGPDCELILNDPKISRVHGEVRSDPPGPRYRDLSKNGTLLERGSERMLLRGREEPLRRGDVLILGDTRLAVVWEREVVGSERDPSESHATVRPLADFAAIRHSVEADRGLLPIVEHWNAITRRLDQEPELVGAFVDLVLEAFPKATHALVLMRDPWTGSLVQRAAASRESGRIADPLSVSRTLLEEVFEQRVAVAGNPSQPDQTQSDSLVSAEIYAYLCAPIWERDQVVGVVQVDSRGQAAEFSPGELDLLAVLANHLALALANSRLLSERLQAERMSTIGSFAAMMLHDMRNAMNVISGYVELLETEPEIERRAEMAEVVRKEITELVELIAEMLAFARGDERMELETVPVGAVLEEVRVRLERIFAGSEIEFSIQGAARSSIQADLRRLIRVFHNVAHNARRALADQGRFWIEVRELPASVELRLCDDGPGIPESLWPHLFTPFVRHPQVSGSGLGLAIVRHIVEAHGGSVSAERLAPRGTAIVIRLPAICPDVDTPIS
ncbi:MAG TPA: ATP-binding protein [Acidobacteriota bacterium]